MTGSFLEKLLTMSGSSSICSANEWRVIYQGLDSSNVYLFCCTRFSLTRCQESKKRCRIFPHNPDLVVYKGLVTGEAGACVDDNKSVGSCPTYAYQFIRIQSTCTEVKDAEVVMGNILQALSSDELGKVLLPNLVLLFIESQ